MGSLILSAYLISGLQLHPRLTLDVKVFSGIPAPVIITPWKGIPVQLRPPSIRQPRCC